MVLHTNCNAFQEGALWGIRRLPASLFMSEIDVQVDLTVSKFSTLIGSEHDLLNVTQLETAGYVQLPYQGIIY